MTYLRSADFRRVIIMSTLSGIGMGLVGVFIPIYLLELGKSFFAVVGWLALHHFFLMVGAFLAVFVSNFFGLVRCLYARIFLVAMLFGGLILLPEYPMLFYLLAFIGGMEAAFFWIPYNILMIRKTNESTMGSALAFVSNVGSAFGIAVPIISAILITSYGYTFLFAFALMFIFVSIIPILSLKSETTDFKFEVPAISKVIKENRHFILPEIIDNLGQDAQVIWVLFLFISSFTIIDIGLLGVIVGLVGMAVTYFTGRLIDKWDKRALVRFGAVGTTIMWAVSYVVAVWAPTPLWLYIVTASRGLLLGIFMASYGAIMFNRARRSDAQFIVLREVPTIFGRLILFSTTLAFIAIGKFELIFLAVAIVSVYFWFNNLKTLLKPPAAKPEWI